MKNQKGITLIALVITIAIMLILAGVTIRVSLKGGLFSKANEATSQMQIEAEKEQLLTVALGALGRNGKVDLTKLDSNLPTGFQKIGTGTYKSSTGNTYQVTEDADIILLNGEGGETEEPDTPVVPPATPTITLSTTQITKEITSGTPETVNLTATLNNASGTLTWTSSDTSVAEISGSGTTRTITLKKAGTSTITVKYGTQATATCSITLTEKQVSFEEDELAGIWGVNGGISIPDNPEIVSWNFNFSMPEMGYEFYRLSVEADNNSQKTAKVNFYEVNQGPICFYQNNGWGSVDVITITSTMEEVENSEELLEWLKTYFEKYETEIEFTINEAPHCATKGMTWEEWIFSYYNPGIYTMKDKYVVNGFTDDYIVLDYIHQVKGNVIQEGSNYGETSEPPPY